jgi:cell division protein FtsZ
MASTPVHGLEKPAEINKIELEDDLKTEINTPLGNPMASVSKVSTNPSIENIQTSNQTLNNEFSSTNHSNPRYSDSVSRVEVQSDLKVTEATVESTPLNEASPVEDSKNIEFNWEVIEQNGLEAPIEIVSINEPVSNVEKPEVIILDLEDDTETIVTKPKSTLSAEEQQQITQERYNRIRTMTTKLKNADGITEFENEPAFVRRNLQINDSNPSTEKPFSRFGLSDDTNGNTTLRGNSFLHDNVD